MTSPKTKPGVSTAAVRKVGLAFNENTYRKTAKRLDTAINIRESVNTTNQAEGHSRRIIIIIIIIIIWSIDKVPVV